MAFLLRTPSSQVNLSLDLRCRSCQETDAKEIEKKSGATLSEKVKLKLARPRQLEVGAKTHLKSPLGGLNSVKRGHKA